MSKAILAQGVDLALKEIYDRLAYAKKADFGHGYKAALQDMCVKLEDMSSRLKRGEDATSSSPVMFMTREEECEHEWQSATGIGRWCNKCNKCEKGV